MDRPFPTPWVKGRAGVSSLGDMEVILGNHIIFLIDKLNSVCADVSLSLPIPSDKPRAVVLESGLETFFYRLGLVLDSLVFGLGLGHRTRQMFKLVSTESSNICFFFSLFQNKTINLFFLN